MSNTNARTLAKRKSETDIIENHGGPTNKRVLTERIAAGMGVLRLTDGNPQDAQGNSRPVFQRTISTPSNLHYGPLFMPSRPDLVSSFELTRPQPVSMDTDMMDSSPQPTSYQQQCITAQQNTAKPIYSQAMLNNAPAPGTFAPVKSTSLREPLYPIIEEEEAEDTTPKLKLLIPSLPPPSLEIPFLHDIAANPSRALILYTSPKEVVEESLARTHINKIKEKVKEKDKEKENIALPQDPSDLMMLD